MEENNIVETPVEMTAGEMLRNARTTGRRKREIPTIAKQLCIREEFLAALEDGDFTVIPETVYILGFARNYAMELGLDPDVVVNKLKREMGLVSECAAASDAVDNADAPVCKVAEKTSSKLFANAISYVKRHWKWFASGLVALILVVVAVVLMTSGGDDNTSTPNVAPVVVTEAEPEYNVAVRERFGLDNRETANVVLQATSESWVKIEDGRGNTVFSRVLVPGDIYYVPAGDKHKGTFGNAGGIDAWVDGKLAPKLGSDHVRKTGVSMAPSALMNASAK